MRAFTLALRASHPDINWPLSSDEVPPTTAILDLVEFCHQAVGKPIEVNYHSFFRHSHLRFDAEEGQAAFRDQINRVLARNGLAYELQPNGLVRRLAPPVLREALGSTQFRTGDAELDSMLGAACAKFLDPDPDIRKESLEKLWDAWERLKTIEPGKDKKASLATLLGNAAPEPKFREALDAEGAELTRIGNS